MCAYVCERNKKCQCFFLNFFFKPNALLAAIDDLTSFVKDLKTKKRELTSIELRLITAATLVEGLLEKAR